MREKIKEKKVTAGDCVQPLLPALSECKQIMQWVLIRDWNLLKPIQYQRKKLGHKTHQNYIS